MYYNDIRDKSLGRKIIETRLLVRKETKWKPFSYKWNDEQTEATRLIVGGIVTASTIAKDGNLKEITISRYGEEYENTQKLKNIKNFVIYGGVFFILGYGYNAFSQYCPINSST